MSGTGTVGFTERERNGFLARLAEHAERYDEMAAYMRAVVAEAPDLTLEERNLLSVAYKNVIGTRRASWRLVMTLLNDLRDKAEGDEAATVAHNITIVEPLKRKVEGELFSICKEVLTLLSTQLIPNAKDVEVKVFYHKMAGDYYRYIAEFTENEQKKSNASSAYDAYREATDIARDSLSPTHPLRLGLALNFSVFYYEVLNSANRACLLAKQAFDDAIPELDTLPDELYHDSKLIMKLLRDNLTFWQNEANVSNEAGEARETGEPIETAQANVANESQPTGADEPTVETPLKDGE